MFHQAYVSIFNFLTDISTTDTDAAIAAVVKRGFCNCAGKTGWGFFLYVQYIYISPHFVLLVNHFCLSMLPRVCIGVYRKFSNQQQLTAARNNKECNRHLRSIKSTLTTIQQYVERGRERGQREHSSTVTWQCKMK